MRRRLIVFVFALSIAAPVAWAHEAIDITSSHIAGAQLGWKEARYRGLLGPVRLDRLEGGYTRLVSARKKVEVYIRGGRGVTITTWSRIYRTDEQVGPCSTVAALKAAYGSKLKPFRQGGRPVAYRLGGLIFTAEDGKRVGVVGLGTGTAAVFIALNATECR